MERAAEVTGSKGERTRARIAATAATLFNERGYAGTSLGDLMQATGLTKGALYNHFEDKDAIAVAAFDHMVAALRGRFETALAVPGSAGDRLAAVVEVFRLLWRLPGGCPVVNTAVEADDTHPSLRERARAAMLEWRDGIAACVRAGQAASEIRADVDAEKFAGLVIGCLEGALVLSRLLGERCHLDAAAEHLRQHIERNVLTGSR